MATIKIKGIHPYDGEYELDPTRQLNAREWRWIKKISGYMPGTIQDGLGGGDPDLVVALAVIVMCRDGKIDRDDGLRVADALAEHPFDGAAITLDAGDEAEEDDALPPVRTSEPDASLPKSSLENTTSSGEPLNNGSGQSDETPSPTTPTRSDTSPTLAQTELAS